ncbi:MAG: glycogen synthase GlgA [Ruminococcaceae bacterium]|nr:glycogen synthase GlgA [Oscillospiraceae bacterium]
MKILFATAEAAPYIKIGGLGDVAAALPKALAQEGAEAAVVLPLYKSIKDRYHGELEYITSFSVPLAWRQVYCGIFRSMVGSVTYYFIDNEYYFLRDSVYGNYDDGERYAYFCKAVLEMLQHIDFFPDIIHANDWQCALIPLFLKAFYQNIEAYRPIKTMFTIHNIEYQGQTPYSFSEDVLGLPKEFMPDISFGGCLNFMFSAICLSDKVTTVSETYATELKMPYYGKEMSPVLSGISYKFCGITNGIDTELFDPQRDPHLFHRYSVKAMGGKKISKRRLREYLGLQQDEDAPILAMVSRLVGHKGLDLVEYVRHELLSRRLQLVVLGTGDERFENMFRELSYQYPERVSANIRFDQDLSSKIYAGCDLFLMPSKSEPCGLSQMIAMRYGAIPIVRETGGLADTVSPVNPEEGTGQGFTFKSYNAHDMLDAVDRALWFYYEKKPELKKVIRSNMEADFSWQSAAGRYMAIYKSM